jgi:hypothetical protein
MNSICNGNGLSARQGAISTQNKTHSKLTGLTFPAIVVGLLLSSCYAKNEDQTYSGTDKDTIDAKADTLNQPDVNIKVNRHYDDKGNLIGFDSTYTSYYSNIDGNMTRMDSLMHTFDQYLNNGHGTIRDKGFNDLFFNDSLRYPDFFHDDYFLKRYELNDGYLRKMMHRMDSIKNHFYQRKSLK